MMRLTTATIVTALSALALPALAADVTWISGNDQQPGGYVTWDRSDANARYAQWDVFTKAYNLPNTPDEGITAGTSASLTQTGTSTAFIIGTGTAGNIYSFSGATAFRVDLSGFVVDGGIGYGNKLVLTAWTNGVIWDYPSAQLSYVDDLTSSTVVVPLLARQSLYSVSGGEVMGNPTLLEQYQWSYDVTGISQALVWTVNGAQHMSTQQFSVDASTYAIPEPASLAMTLLGGLLAIRRPRQA